MTPTMFLDMVKETVMLIIILAAPVLVVAMVVGIAISLLQAVTQIQEATLTFVPKIMACLATLVIVSPWMLKYYISHAQGMLRNLAYIAHHITTH